MSQYHPPVLVLDRPCSYCRLLELDDPRHDAPIQHDLSDHPHVKSIKVNEKEYLKTNLGTSIHKLSELEFERHDVLPSLPGLAETASLGCVFCKVLREDLISATTRNQKSDGRDAFADDENTAKLIITKFAYGYGNTKIISARPDALYVYFTDFSESEHGIELSLHYTIYLDFSAACAPWSSLGSLPMSHNRLSEPFLTRMKALIDGSLQQIPFENSNGYLPTRLLDLQAGCASGLRLVITQEDPDIQRLDYAQRKYAALSYCWGSPAEAEFQLKTTHITLASHKSEIQLNKVPKTISDAIKLCRKLGIRYLWVDALCIIQHDPQGASNGDAQDWIKESFKMSQTYSNSYITLCIMKGNSCMSGFLEPSHTPPTVQITLRSRINSSITGCIYLRMLYPPRDNLQPRSFRLQSNFARHCRIEFDSEFGKSAWSTRGWTFQEEQLSPRKLYFGKHMFYITSAERSEAADGSPFYRNNLFSDLDDKDKLSEVKIKAGKWYRLVNVYTQRKLSFRRDTLPAMSALAKSVCNRFPKQRYLASLWASDRYDNNKLSEFEIKAGEWYRLVNVYTQRKLTYTQDTLPAISALARLIYNRFPEQRYLAGLWASDLHRGLLWTSKSSVSFDEYYQSLEATYIAPSWSWASCPLSNLPVLWITPVMCYDSYKATFRSEITLVHDDIVVDKNNPYGIVTSARLIMRGKIFKPPLGADGRIRVSRGVSIEYLMKAKQCYISTLENTEYILFSETNEYIANLNFDWDCHSIKNDSRGYPQGPINELSLLLVSTSDGFRYYPEMIFDYFPDSDLAFGILIRPKPGMENAYEKLGIWCSEPKDHGGKNFWENISMQELTLV